MLVSAGRHPSVIQHHGAFRGAEQGVSVFNGQNRVRVGLYKHGSPCQMIARGYSGATINKSYWGGVQTDANVL